MMMSQNWKMANDKQAFSVILPQEELLLFMCCMAAVMCRLTNHTHNYTASILIR